MEYDIIYSRSEIQLVKEVNYAIGLGWKPIGGICITFNDEGSTIKFYQALIKE